MSKINNLISAEEIVLMVENNNSLGWEHLYDRYSPMMYGAILRLTGNEKLAEEILTESFLQLKKNISLLKNRKSLYLQLLQHTYTTAAAIIKNKIIIPHEENEVAEMFPLVNGLMQRQLSLSNIAAMHGMTEVEVKLNLHKEVKQMRNKNRNDFKLYAVL